MGQKTSFTHKKTCQPAGLFPIAFSFLKNSKRDRLFFIPIHLGYRHNLTFTYSVSSLTTLFFKFDNQYKYTLGCENQRFGILNSLHFA